jgi:hypothetical protein
MVRKLRTHRLVGAGGLCLLAARPVYADTEAIRIEYRGPSACPSSEQFVGEVLKRAGNVRLASATETARTFVVVIERDAAGYAGSLTIRERGEETFARKVAGRECGAVADALVLSTALAVDPTATDATRPSSPAAPGSGGADAGPASPATAGAPESDRSGDNAAAKQDDEQRPEAKTPDAEQPEPDSEPEIATQPEYEAPITPPIWRQKWSFAIALGPELRLWNTPRPALGGTARFAAYPSEASRPFGALGLELTVLQSLDETIDDAAASFRLLVARPFVCALLGRPGQGVEVLPCLTTEVGTITGEGSNLPKPSTEHRFWFALETELRIEKTLGERGILGLAAGAVFPLTRYRYSFADPDTSIYEIPAVAFAANLRFGWHL